MANSCRWLAVAALLLAISQLTAGARKLAELYQPAPTPDSLMTYHNGTVLVGDVTVSILWYGPFTAAQKSVITDFILSFGSTSTPSPSVGQWWSMIRQLYLSRYAAVAVAAAKDHGAAATNAQIRLGKQVSDVSCSMGKTLTTSQVSALASKVAGKNGGIAVVLTAKNVTVEGSCMNTCASHALAADGTPFIWVGDLSEDCPGQCAWPFSQPEYGPQNTLVSPNNDIGADSIVVNLASMIAGAVTNPSGGGFFQGSSEEPMEAATACGGAFGSRYYPGFPGNLLIDRTTGASYNCHGEHERKYLLPALYDPSTLTCWTLV